MFRKLAISAAAAVLAGSCLVAPAFVTPVFAGGEPPDVPNVNFSFEGPFGTFDRNQLQRGLQIYTQVCSACHGLKYVPIRTLGDPGGPQLPKDQVRAYAARLTVTDPETGQTRPAKPFDNFPANDTMGAPDLSLMALARAGFHGPYGLGITQLFKGMGGPEYIVAILTSFTGKTKTQAGSTFYQNTTFPGGWIRMPQPLHGHDVTFADKSPNDLKHEAEDVAAFLTWAAEPKLDARKSTGFEAVIYLGLLSILLFFTNKRLWAGVKGKKSA